jgi:tetratricopeptide (TPR) repeat protein
MKRKSQEPNALSQAQELIYEAWENDDPRQRLVLARKALKLYADCADAYVLLADAAASPVKALELYRQGIEAGVRALGSAIFVEQCGHFWGLLQTRPYMRARAGMALVLWQCGEHDKAIMNWNDLLRLNADDNLGLRYVLAARLLELGRDDELALLLERHANDGRAYLLWVRALLLFRLLGDQAKSREALNTALASNPHVPAYLLGHKPLRTTQRLRYMSPGDDYEAAYWAAETIKAWSATPGALTWLTKHVHAKPTLLH